MGKSKKFKEIRRRIRKRDTDIFVAVRNRYGDKTFEMNENQVYKATKKLLKKKEI